MQPFFEKVINTNINKNIRVIYVTYIHTKLFSCTVANTSQGVIKKFQNRKFVGCFVYQLAKPSYNFIKPVFKGSFYSIKLDIFNFYSYIAQRNNTPFVQLVQKTVKFSPNKMPPPKFKFKQL